MPPVPGACSSWPRTASAPSTSSWSPGIPDKGVVLTQLSSFWFEALRHVAPSHVLATSLAELPEPFCDVEELRGRACLVQAVRILPVECIVRGYLVGSGWKEYQASGTVCGLELPSGLRQADRLPEPIFTPSTKAEEGHDENISFDRMAELVGAATGRGAPAPLPGHLQGGGQHWPRSAASSSPTPSSSSVSTGTTAWCGPTRP